MKGTSDLVNEEWYGLNVDSFHKMKYVQRCNTLQ